MFGPEYIPAAYLEERLAAEKAKREAEEKRQQEQPPAAATKQSHCPGQPTASSLSQVFAQQRPGISSPGSSTLLGSIYQNLTKTAGGAATPTSSHASRGHTPSPREMTAEEKRAFDERWKEIDMVVFSSHTRE